MLIRLMKWIATAILGIAVIVGAAFFALRFADGPTGIVAGGAFESGERWVGPEPDWSFLKDRAEVEFQLVDPPRSRTTWILEHEGRIYIPAAT